MFYVGCSSSQPLLRLSWLSLTNNARKMVPKSCGPLYGKQRLDGNLTSRYEYAKQINSIHRCLEVIIFILLRMNHFLHLVLQPAILPVQILRIGQLVILSVPGGRKLKLIFSFYTTLSIYMVELSVRALFLFLCPQSSIKF